jgi:hypothetical protein
LPQALDAFHIAEERVAQRIATLWSPKLPIGLDMPLSADACSSAPDRS